MLKHGLLVWSVIAGAVLAAETGCSRASHVVGDTDAADAADVDGHDGADVVPDAAPDTIDDVHGDAPEDETTDAPDDSVDVVEEEFVDPLYTDDDGDGFSEFEGDCDDADDGIYPGATTHVEGIDYDCDGRREFLAKMYVAVDDEFSLCANGVSLATCTASYPGECFVEDQYYEYILESGLNSIGVNGWDTVGISASFAMWIEAAGTEVITRGIRSGGTDWAKWRYFPTSGEAPQTTWCDQSFDASSWGPALFASEVGDTLGFHHPPSMVKLGSNWVWDGNPSGIRDSWFRLELMLPDVDPVWDPPGSPTCTMGTPHLVSNPTTTTEKRTDNGCDVVWNGSGWVVVYDEWVRPWCHTNPACGCDDVQTRLMAADGTPAGAGTNINDMGTTDATNAKWWNMWPVAVWTGSEVGTFFEDARTNRIHDYLYGHRTTSTGAAIGSDIRLDTTGTTQKFPSAAWSGSEYAVVWQDDQSGDFEIYFKRFDASMAPIGSAVRLTSSAGASRVPEIAWNGSEYGVVWEDERNGGDQEIYFTRVSAAGTKIGPDVRLTTFPGQSLDPEIAWSGAHYGIAWHDDGWVNMEIGFMTIDATGAIVTAPVRLTEDSSVSEGADIVWTGSAYGIAWRDSRTGNGDIYLAVVRPDGTKVSGDDQVTDTVGISIQPAIAWSGTAFGIAWKEEEDPADSMSTPWNLDTWFVTVSCP
jgi:hypothetical protein